MGNKMFIFGGANWVTQSATTRMWIYDQVLLVSARHVFVPWAAAAPLSFQSGVNA